MQEFRSVRRLHAGFALLLAGAVALSALPTVTSSAQQAPPMPSKDPAMVKAGTYTADPVHTLVGWRINHLGLNDYFGIFGDVTGTLEIDPADPATAKLDVTIPVATITTASARLEEHLMRPGKDGGQPDFFGPDPAPARFVSKSVTRTGENSAQIVGDLTFNGVTKPVAIIAELTGVGPNPLNKVETIGFEGRAIMRRSDFGLTTFLPVLGDEIELDITAAFELK